MTMHTKNPNSLSAEQKLALDEMVERRMRNTGESREDAAAHIAKYLAGNVIPVGRGRSRGNPQYVMRSSTRWWT
jgi:hypothetical protein